MSIKSMSFGKLLGIFFGIFAVVILATIGYMKIANGNKQTQMMASQKHTYQSPQIPQSPPMPTQIAAQPSASQTVGMPPENQVSTPSAQNNTATTPVATDKYKYDGLGTSAAVSSKDIQAAVQQSTANLEQQISQLSVNITALTQRISALENKRTNVDTVAKKSHKENVSEVKKMGKNSVALSQSSGYKVQATVGKRAWIKAGDKEETVTVGEILPPVSKQLKVVAVDNDSGIVITTHDPKTPTEK